jgi:hypothetical protein
MIRNPQMSEMVLPASVVLNPWNKMALAMIVDVVKKT